MHLSARAAEASAGADGDACVVLCCVRSADYYWFRNHTPDSRMPQSTAEDLAKLTTKLVPDPPSAAYACGCSWQSVRARAPRGR